MIYGVCVIDNREKARTKEEDSSGSSIIVKRQGTATTTAMVTAASASASASASAATLPATREATKMRKKADDGR
uniref:Uncharacterized protein n=1 Tax=Vespula pensylvanica TaxID=30213 RepID=A0A834P009_VESPE|nr:hypothetical protein H0235_008397 [Vespula pensylvanica]